MAANLEKIVDQLSELSVMEAAELSKLLEEKWGVSAAAPVAVAAAPGEAAGAVAEKEEFDVVLAAGGDNNPVRRLPGAPAIVLQDPREARRLLIDAQGVGLILDAGVDDTAGTL